jgi:glycosyltransferase involved in cell wall biosynthesis
MHSLHIPSTVEWELLAVNNNSTDETDGVLRKHEGCLPLRRLFEPTPGKSHALNLAIREAQGEYLLFTDDDVSIDRGWLAAYCGAFERWPEAAFFGGRIEPWYETPPPDWVVANFGVLEGMLALRDFGDEERLFLQGEMPFGANMALPRSVFDNHTFDAELGPNEDTHLRGEETDLLARLVAEGQTGVWVPEAGIRHITPAERMTSRYVWNYGYGNGRALVRAGGWPPCRRWRGVPLSLYLEYPALRAKAAARRMVGRLSWVEPYMAAARCRGKIEESRLRSER